MAKSNSSFQASQEISIWNGCTGMPLTKEVCQIHIFPQVPHQQKPTKLILSGNSWKNHEIECGQTLHKFYGEERFRLGESFESLKHRWEGPCKNVLFNRSLIYAKLFLRIGHKYVY